MLPRRRPGLLAGRTPAPPTVAAQPPLEPLSDSEIRVLRYLPANLSAREIANELYVSTNTVKTHMHHLYAKHGTHRRGEAVERARALGPARTLRTPALTQAYSRRGAMADHGQCRRAGRCPQATAG